MADGGNEPIKRTNRNSIMWLIEENLETQEVNLKTLEEAIAVSKPLIDGIQLRRASVVADLISSANGFFEIVQDFQERSKWDEDIDCKVAEILPG